MRDWKANISTVFFILSLFIAVIAIVQLVSFPLWMKKSSSAAGIASLKSFQASSLAPIEEYQKQFSSHALFSKPKAPVIVKAPGLTDLIKNYALVGIVHGAESEALIRNNTTRLTSYVLAGEEFDKFKVIKINPHSIIVGYKDEQTELFIEGENR